jgi:hypothetical protein
MSITVRARDFNPCLFTRKTRQVIATSLNTCTHDASTTSFATRLTSKALGHDACHNPYHMIMTGRVVIQVNTFTAVVYLSRFNNSYLKLPVSTLVDLIFQSLSFSVYQLTCHYMWETCTAASVYLSS